MGSINRFNIRICKGAKIRAIAHSNYTLAPNHMRNFVLTVERATYNDGGVFNKEIVFGEGGGIKLTHLMSLPNWRLHAKDGTVVNGECFDIYPEDYISEEKKRKEDEQTMNAIHEAIGDMLKNDVKEKVDKMKNQCRQDALQNRFSK